MSKSKETTLQERYAENIAMHLDSFGLGRWAVTVEGWNKDLKEEYMAMTSTNVEGRTVAFNLNAKEILKHYPTTAERFVDRCAIHEVTHLLTARLAEYAMSRTIDKDALDEEMEAIAVAMERFVFGQVEVI